MDSDISSLQESFQDFNIENVKTSLKTEEELDKLTVDESLNDVERSVFLLSSGQEVQCISVVRNLPQLLKGWQNECIRRVIPKVKELLHTAGLDIQMAASEVFANIAKDNSLHSAVYTQHFLRTIISNLNTKDPVTSQAWLDCLTSVISVLSRDVVRREILGLAIAKGQLSQSTASRLSCCSILGAIALKFDTNVVKKDIVYTVKQLCQDVEQNVRTCMCKHLHSVAIALGAEETKKSLLEEVLELAGDEEAKVREAALDALLKITSLLDHDILTQNVVPVTSRFCEQSLQTEDSTMVCVAENFGRICHNLSASMSSQQRAWYLSTYRSLCKLGRPPLDPPVEGAGEVLSSPSTSEEPGAFNANEDNPERQQLYTTCRQHCAYNFPAVALFCTASAFQTELLDSISLLCTDPDIIVRKHIAAGLHEVAQSLEAQAHLIQPLLVLLLREKQSPTVLEVFLKRLPETLTAVIIRGNLADNKFEGLLPENYSIHYVPLNGELSLKCFAQAHTPRVEPASLDLAATPFEKSGAKPTVPSRRMSTLFPFWFCVNQRVQGLTELTSALLSTITQLEEVWPSAWRPMEALVTHLRRLPDVLTSDQIYYKFVPRVFKLLTTNRYLPVREASACTVCVFIRHNRKFDQRREMCKRLIDDLCLSNNFRNRILFFTACRHIMALFSRSFFKENFFGYVLNLFTDPVPNVRLCLCRILPSMKALLKLPRDRTLHGSLETSVRKLLSTEKDRDVSAAIRHTILELDRTEVAMESLTQKLLDVDLQDKKKEEEERMLVEKDEKAKDEDTRSIKSLASSYSSSSAGKCLSKIAEKNAKKRRSFSISTGSPKGNGARERAKSLQPSNASGSTGLMQPKNGELRSQNSSLSALYSIPTTTSSQHSTRNLVNHFSHPSYMSTANNPANHGPSTALGHRVPHYQALGQSRSGPNSSSSSFDPSSSPSSHRLSVPNNQTASNKPHRRSDRRKASAVHNSGNSTLHGSKESAGEQRIRRGSISNLPPTAGRTKAAVKLLRKSSLTNNPVQTTTSKNRKDKVIK